MTQRSVSHGVFTIDRTYDASPARVFAAWATAEGKAQWFAGPDDWATQEREFDFRPGGRERLKGVWPNGRVSDFQSRYFDIVPNARIVYAYEMHIDGTKISVSLATVEFKPAGAGTRLVVTEQGAFLDGYDDAGSREHGTGALLDKLEAALQRQSATA